VPQLLQQDYLIPIPHSPAAMTAVVLLQAAFLYPCAPAAAAESSYSKTPLSSSNASCFPISLCPSCCSRIILFQNPSQQQQCKLLSHIPVPQLLQQDPLIEKPHSAAAMKAAFLYPCAPAAAAEPSYSKTPLSSSNASCFPISLCPSCCSRIIFIQYPTQQHQ
jgi:hypothetical protein